MQLDSSGLIKVVPDSHGRTPQPASGHLGSVLRAMPSDFMDLVAAMLTWEPAQRITPEAAMQHSWITQCGSGNHDAAHAGRTWSVPAHWETRWAAKATAAGRSPLTEAGNMQHGLGQLEPTKRVAATGIKRKGGIGMLLSMPGRRRS
jgi:hypothetical protein